MIPVDEFLHYPPDNQNPDVIIVCSVSTERQDELKEILLTAGYGVCGPFQSYLDIFEILGRTDISAIIFDTRDNYSNSFKFLNGMIRYPEYPLLIIGPIDHTINSKLDRLSNKVAELNFPLLSRDVIRKINLVTGRTTGFSQLVTFLNEIFENIIKICPRDKVPEIRKILVYHVEQLAQGSDFFDIDSENAIFLSTSQVVDDDEMIKVCQRVIRDIIEDINYQLNSDEEWGKSMVHDAIYQAYYKFKGTEGPVRDLLETLELDDINFYNRIINFVGSKTNITCNIAHFVLEDIGPVVDIILREEMEFSEVFTPMAASQIISLMGQGENYHEGLYGPIPSMVNPGAMILIYSRMIPDETMEDIRLHGKTLSVLALAFKKEMMNILPSRSVLNSIFTPFIEIESRQDVSSKIMEEICHKFTALFENKH